MKLILLLLFNLIYLIHACCQSHNLPDFPITSCNAELKEYNYAQKVYEKSVRGLNSPYENFEYKSILHGWSIFLAFVKIKPENKKLVLDVFYNRLAYEPISFCENFNEDFLSKFDYDTSPLQYLKFEVNAMENVCNCILSNTNDDLVKLLIQIDEDDQKYRKDESLFYDKKYGELQKKLDKENLRKIDFIIKHHGYPGRNLVGTEYEDVAFLIIQHSDSTTIEKYIDVVKNAVDNKILKPRAYAYLVDRLAVWKNEPQIYGTQYHTVNGERVIYPIKDTEQVNKERYKMGIGRLDQYKRPKKVGGLIIDE
ncbi:MAG: hypothetical protein P1U56_18265 [Saprospiraceae bacterium]|nr:hypothetical protein [Saprospiraceae bacterium]